VTDPDPLTPDADEARRWIERELSDAAYTEAQPTPIDRAARAVGDFIGSLLRGGSGPDWGPAVAVIAIVILVVLLVAAFAIWGRPRAVSRRIAREMALFGADEGRSAADLRRDADRHAAASRWDAAIADRMRALARMLSDRGVVESPPGTTVHGFARRAGGVFPAHAARLEAAASAFDDVRYLRRPGTAEAYRALADLDDELAAAAASPRVAAR
jgi:hypothetical protein